MIGSVSLLLTGSLKDNSLVPLGAVKGLRGPLRGFSRLVPGGMCLGVPLKAGLGSLIFISTLSAALSCAPAGGGATETTVATSAANHVNL